MKTLEDLRSEGFKVVVHVDRLPFHTGEELTESAKMGYPIRMGDIIEESVPMPVLHKITGKNKVWGNGGVMAVRVWAPERKDEEGATPDYEVMAVCSVLDQFKKKTGHRICLGRLNILLSGGYYEWPREYQGKEDKDG